MNTAGIIATMATVATQEESRAKSSIVAEERKQVNLLGSLRKVPGHTLFELNLNTGELKPAMYKEVDVELSGKVRLKLIANEGCTYVQALNRTNAVRKLKKQGIVS